jgi:hypothetical protein
MPKRTKKLLVYLDQNFISNMAKGRVNERVNPEFGDVFSLPTAYLTLATLPLSEFTVYWQGDGDGYRRLPLIWARRDENRRTHGWTAEERSSNGLVSIQHKYVRVEHQAI